MSNIKKEHYDHEAHDTKEFAHKYTKHRYSTTAMTKTRPANHTA